MLKNIGIIGNGFVGKAVKESFKKYFNVFVFDLDKNKANIATLEELVKTMATTPPSPPVFVPALAKTAIAVFPQLPKLRALLTRLHSKKVYIDNR